MFFTLSVYSDANQISQHGPKQIYQTSPAKIYDNLRYTAQLLKELSKLNAAHARPPERLG